MRNNTKKIALSGILLAFTIITLFLATTLPVNELSLYALSSFFIAVIIMEFGAGAGWGFYAASCLLALLLPNKLAVVPYLVFFGVYGLFKYYIEKLNRLILEYFLKLAFFNVFVAIAFIVLRQLLLEQYDKFPWWLVVLGLQIAFIAYDYVYTLCVQYYRERLKKLLKI